MFTVDLKDSICELFKYRVSIGEDIEKKELNKLDEELRKKIKKFVENETKEVKFRAFREIDEKLQEIRGEFNKELEKLEKKQSFEDFSDSFAKIETKLIENFFVDLNHKTLPEDHKLSFLLSQVFINLQEVSKEAKESLQRETIRPSHAIMGTIVNILTAMILVLLRVDELSRHWRDADETQKQQMEDLLYWDLNTLSNYTLALPTQKEKIKIGKKSEKEVLMALFR